MVTEWVLRALAAVWEWFIGNLPALPVPDWFGQASDAISGVVEHVQGLGGWFPFTILGVVIGTVLAALVVSLGLKVARIVLSLFTAGGGSAG